MSKRSESTFPCWDVACRSQMEMDDKVNLPSKTLLHSWFREESQLPLTLNCWPSPSGNETYVNMDYEASSKYELKNVCISIPLPGGKSPTVNEVDGDWQYNARHNQLEWIIDIIDDSNSTGALEFVVPAADPDDFFPVDITFTISNLICDVDVESVIDSESGGELKWSCVKSLKAGNYQIV